MNGDCGASAFCRRQNVSAFGYGNVHTDFNMFVVGHIPHDRETVIEGNPLDIGAEGVSNQFLLARESENL